MKKLLFILIAAALACASCGNKEKAPAAAAEPATEATEPVEQVAVERLDKLDSAAVAAKAMPLWLSAAGVENAGELSDSPWMAAFKPAVDSVFAGDAGIVAAADALGRINGLMKLQPRIEEMATVVLPYRQSVLVDSAAGTVMVVLNHYLGASHPAYNGFSAYERAMKTPARIAPDAVEAAINVYAPVDDNGRLTVASAMLREGAIVELIMQACGISEAEALGYDAATYARACEVEQEAWKALVEKRLLFSGNPSDARAILAPAPSTPLLGDDMPGRMGRFVGHRLARAWLDAHPGRTAADILAPAVYAAENPLATIKYSSASE